MARRLSPQLCSSDFESDCECVKSAWPTPVTVWIAAAPRLPEGERARSNYASSTSVPVGVSAGSPVLLSSSTAAPSGVKNVLRPCHFSCLGEERLRIPREFLKLLDAQRLEQLAFHCECLVHRDVSGQRDLLLRRTSTLFQMATSVVGWTSRRRKSLRSRCW
jgi:hypothetical protein